MPSARIDPGTIMRMVSEVLATINGTGVNQLTVRQLGAAEPTTLITAWCRLLGMNLQGKQRQRSGLGSPDEPDIATIQIRIGVYVSQEQIKPAAIGTAARIVAQAFDELTKQDTLEATEANKHRMDLHRPLIEIVDEPDEERGIRAALVTIDGTVERTAGVTTENFLN